MSKQNKTQEPNEPLATIKPKDSVFSHFTKSETKVASSAIITQETDNSSSQIAKESLAPVVPSLITNKEQVLSTPAETFDTPKPTLPLVYEVIFMQQNEQGKPDEIILYTVLKPQFLDNGELLIQNAFGRKVFTENILGQKQVQMSCKYALDQEQFSINCKIGLLLKTLETQQWMISDYETTKKAFDELVLKEYRALTQQLANTPQKQKQVPIQQSNEQVQIREGNLPINRPPLIQDF